MSIYIKQHEKLNGILNLESMISVNPLLVIFNYTIQGFIHEISGELFGNRMQTGWPLC